MLKREFLILLKSLSENSNNICNFFKKKIVKKNLVKTFLIIFKNVFCRENFKIIYNFTNKLIRFFFEITKA